MEAAGLGGGAVSGRSLSSLARSSARFVRRGLHGRRQRTISPFGCDGLERVHLVAFQATQFSAAGPVRHRHQSLLALRAAGHVHENGYGVARSGFKKPLQTLNMYKKVHRNQTDGAVFALHE